MNGSLMWPPRPLCVWSIAKFMCTDLFVLWLRDCSEVALCLWLIVAEHETVAEYQFAYSRSALKVCAGDGKVHHFERGKSPHPEVTSSYHRLLCCTVRICTSTLASS